MGVGLLLGQCGIVNLGQAAFYGLGAYSCAYLTVEMGYPNIAGFVVGAAVSVAIALVVGWPVLRLTGYFLALATLALEHHRIVALLRVGLADRGRTRHRRHPEARLLRLQARHAERAIYYLAGRGLLLHAAGEESRSHSRTGLMLRGMRDSSDAAASLGIDLQWLRTRVFMLSALFGSLAGSLFAHYVSFTSVQSFTVDRSISFLLIPVLDGVARCGVSCWARCSSPSCPSFSASSATFTRSCSALRWCCRRAATGRLGRRDPGDCVEARLVEG